MHTLLGLLAFTYTLSREVLPQELVHPPNSSNYFATLSKYYHLQDTRACPDQRRPSSVPPASPRTTASDPFCLLHADLSSLEFAVHLCTHSMLHCLTHIPNTYFVEDCISKFPEIQKPHSPQC